MSDKNNVSETNNWKISDAIVLMFGLSFASYVVLIGSVLLVVFLSSAPIYETLRQTWQYAIFKKGVFLIVGISGILCYAHRIRHFNPVTSLALNIVSKKHVFSMIALGIFTSFISWALISYFNIPVATEETAKLLKNPPYLALSFIFAISIGPVFEELLYRGVLFPAVDRKYGFVAASLVTACLFVLAHAGVRQLNPAAFSVGFISAMMYAFLRKYTRSTSSCIFAHAGYNFAAYFMLFLRIAAAQK